MVGALLVGTNHQYRVVTSDGSDGFLPILSVERSRHGLRATYGGLDDQLILRRPHLQHELAHQSRNWRQGGLGYDFTRQRVPRPGLHQAQLVNITRKRGLADFQTTSAQGALKVLLAAYRLFFQQLQDDLLSQRLAHMNDYSS